ncbi:MAG: hypothetical protein EZS28_015434 [Streblomastix strix]|uniref:Uncharacterized protein n=1 Tax=Streblomastix strix TaxID=222440 RepID=A0A5J4W3D8_9EUKA|nr:MAG: hypothetical protein EZS28_015434 [Streblomastix strix]
MNIDLDAEEKYEDENVEEIGRKITSISRKQANDAGTVDALLLLLSTQPLEMISLSHIYAFFIFTNSFSDEIGEMLYNRNPYISLIHLFDHQDFFIINRSAISMWNLLNNGVRIRPLTASHQQYQNMIACGGIKKLFILFKKYANKDIKISTSLCIGHLFRAKEITDQSMKREIISYLKMLKNERYQMAKNSAKYRLILLVHQKLNLNNKIFRKITNKKRQRF